MRRLTDNQLATLADLIQSGPEMPPGGYRNAHIDAAGWWRTMESLRQMGFVRLTSVQGGGVARVTPDGRAYYFDLMERRLSR